VINGNDHQRKNKKAYKKNEKKKKKSEKRCGEINQ